MKPPFLAFLIIGFTVSPLLWAQDLDAGKKIYQVSCMACHGKTGTGDKRMAKILTVDPVLLDIIHGLASQKPDSELLSIVSGGLTMMPAFNKLYTPDQVQSVVYYLRTLQLDAQTKKLPGKKKRVNP